LPNVGTAYEHGSVLDERYRLLDPIGEGGMGTVYRATHLRLERPVAVKVLLPEFGESEELRLRFEREAKNHAAMTHPHIVTVTDYGLVDNVPFLVMELLEGIALDEVIAREGPLDPERIRLIFEQTLRALSFAHSKGLAHRDLKPANIFLQRMSDAPVHVKLLDFGLAKFVAGERVGRSGAALTKSGTIVGTPAYMSPEQATGQGGEATSDVYSAGIVLFEMLTGERPYRGEPVDLIRHHLVTPLPSIESACPGLTPSVELVAFLEKATAKEAGARFENASEMLDAFSAITTLVTGAPLPKPESMGRPSRAPTALGKGTPDPAHAPTALADSGFASATTMEEPKRARHGLSIIAVGAAATILVGLTIATLFVIDVFGSEEATAATPTTAAPAATTPAPTPPPVTTTAGEDENEDAPAPAGALGGAIAEVVGGVLADGEEGADEDEDAAATAPEPVPEATADPWEPPIPRTLASIRRHLRRGRTMSRSAHQTLRRYAERNRDDPRVFLLLGHGYVSRGWRPDALERYERAYELDANVKNDPQMRANLGILAAHGNVGRAAQRLLTRAYGAESRHVVDEALAGDSLSRDERARLRAFRDSL
jgi:serine/threonine-protein kinase